MLQSLTRVPKIRSWMITFLISCNQNRIDRETLLHTAGREMSMKCRVMQPMCFSTHGFEFRQSLHVVSYIDKTQLWFTCLRTNSSWYQKWLHFGRLHNKISALRVVSHVSLTTELGGTTVQVGIVNRLTEGLALGPKVMFIDFPFKASVNFPKSRLALYLLRKSIPRPKCSHFWYQELFVLIQVNQSCVLSM
jgi:hypothetical protein